MQEEQSSTSLKQKAYLAIGVLSITVAVTTAGVSLYRRYKYERLKEDLITSAESSSYTTTDDETFTLYRSEVDYLQSISKADTNIEVLPSDDLTLLSGDMKLAPIKDGVKVLEIPKLDIKAPVLEGVDYETLAVAVGHFPSTGKVGMGNFCVAGHSVSPYACIFDNLHSVKLDMPVYLYDAEGTKFTYWVTDYFTVMPTEVWVLNDFGDNRLTMITCDDKGKSRLVVVALEMSEEEHEQYVRNREVDKRLQVKDISYDLANIDIHTYLEERGMVRRPDGKVTYLPDAVTTADESSEVKE